MGKGGVVTDVVACGEIAGRRTEVDVDEAVVEESLPALATPLEPGS